MKRRDLGSHGPRFAWSALGTGCWASISVLRCYHVEMNTESGSLLLDNEKRNQDYQRQYDAIGGV